MAMHVSRETYAGVIITDLTRWHKSMMPVNVAASILSPNTDFYYLQCIKYHHKPRLHLLEL